VRCTDGWRAEARPEARAMLEIVGLGKSFAGSSRCAT